MITEIMITKMGTYDDMIIMKIQYHNGNNDNIGNKGNVMVKMYIQWQ